MPYASPRQTRVLGGSISRLLIIRRSSTREVVPREPRRPSGVLDGRENRIGQTFYLAFDVAVLHDSGGPSGAHARKQIGIAGKFPDGLCKRFDVARRNDHRIFILKD